MESAKSTENLTTRSGNDNNNKIQLVLLVIAVVVAIVALIVAFIALSQKGTTNLVMSSDGGSSGAQRGSSGSYDDQKVWSIAIGHEDASSSYIDEVTGALSGFYPDIVNAVCKVGNKNCRIIYDVWNRCWDSQAGQVARGGVGLMDSWYDACAGWYGTRDRYRTFTFTNAFSKAEEESLFVKKGSALGQASSWKDVTNRKVGILDGWWTSEFCLLLNKEQFDAGLPLTETQIIHYFGPPDLLEAINNGDVDFAFIGIKTSIAGDLERVEGDPVLPCSLQGPGVMIRQVDTPFLDWFNPALDQLMKSPEYNNVCQDLAQAHGHFPGLDPKESCFLD